MKFRKPTAHRTVFTPEEISLLIVLASQWQPHEDVSDELLSLLHKAKSLVTFTDYGTVKIAPFEVI
jgi:hypothetical protein